MRLTLRTLLAYLDDVLDPAQSKELGQKIQDSPVALKMIERIKEVTRKRRVNSPELGNTTLDANQSAAYLDNTLDPSKVSDIEQICLDNDEYLAEVAACHQILTLVLGEPVEVAPDSRERMYQLEHHKDGKVRTFSSQPSASNAKQSQEKTVTPVTKTTETPVPEYLKRDSLLQRYWPVTLLFALGIGWLYVIYTDDTFRQNNKFAQNDNVNPQVTPPNGVAGNQNNPAGNPQDKGGSSSPNATSAETQNGSKNSNTPVTTTPGTSQNPPENKSPGDKPGPTNTAGNNTTPGTQTGTGTQGGAMNNPASPGDKKNPMPDNNKPEKPPVITNVPLPLPTLLYRFNQDLLIRQKVIGDDWYVVSGDQTIVAQELIACPKPYRATLEFTKINLKIQIDGGTVMQFLSPTPETDFGIEIKRGRVIISRLDEAADLNNAVKIDLLVGNQNWPMTFGSGKILVGMDVRPRLPEHLEEDFGNQTHQVTLRTDQGKTTIKMPDATVQTINDQQQVVLAKLDKMHPTLKDLTITNMGNLNPSDWLKENDQYKTGLQKKYGKEFLDEIDAGPADAPLPVWLSIAPLANGSNSKIAEFAAQTLSLKTWKSGDQAVELINCIARTGQQEARIAALDGIREWLPTSKDNPGILRQELAKVFPESTALVLYQLLWGFNEQDLRNINNANKMLEWLLHEDVNVRELTIYHIDRITGSRNSYKPLEPLGLRETMVKRWKIQLDRDGSLFHNKKDDKKTP